LVSYDEFVRYELEVAKGRVSAKSLHELRTTLEEFGRFSGAKTLSGVTPRMVECYFSARLQEVRPPMASPMAIGVSLLVSVQAPVLRGRSEGAGSPWTEA
jgi:hypothetical protein